MMLNNNLSHFWGSIYEKKFFYPNLSTAKGQLFNRPPIEKKPKHPGCFCMLCGFLKKNVLSRSIRQFRYFLRFAEPSVYLWFSLKTNGSVSVFYFHCHFCRYAA